MSRVERIYQAVKAKLKAAEDDLAEGNKEWLDEDGSWVDWEAECSGTAQQERIDVLGEVLDLIAATD